jgi:hypothetical protein
MIGSCGTSCGSSQLMAPPVMTEMIEGEAVVAPTPDAAVPVPAAAAAPADSATLVPFGSGIEDGLIDGGNVVNVSPVQAGATVAVDSSVTSQNFDPASAFGPAKSSDAMKSDDSLVIGKAPVAKATEASSKSTIVEASPMTLDPTPAQGMVQLASDIELPAE